MLAKFDFVSNNSPWAVKKGSCLKCRIRIGPTRTQKKTTIDLLKAKIIPRTKVITIKTKKTGKCFKGSLAQANDPLNKGTIT